MKVCTKCGVRKGAKDFSVDNQKPDGKRCWCKGCHQRSTREWNAANPERKRRSGREWYATRRERVLDDARVKRYGVTTAQCKAMLAAQGNRCAVCGADKPGGKGDWHVDHDHKTGKVRGMLCHKCNVGLGHFDDNPAILKSAILYLRNS